MSIAPGNVQYNYAQLEGIWTQAGGSSGSAPIAAAIAMAESGGNSTATGQNSGSVDRGLWQINSVHGTQSTYDVMGNARAAVAISSNGTNWTPWTTYTNGAYRQYLQVGVSPDTSAPINATNAQANNQSATLTGLPLPGGLWDPANWWLDPLGSGGQAIGGAASTIGPPLIKFAMQGLIKTMLNPLIQIMAGIMGIGAGAIMVIVGLWIMARQTETGAAAERGAGWAAQTGLSFAGPESAAVTRYVGQGGQTTTVSAIRRPPGQVRMGGRRYTYRPGTVRTAVSREGAATYGDTYQGPRQRGTKEQIRDEANGYAQNGGRKR